MKSKNEDWKTNLKLIKIFKINNIIYIEKYLKDKYYYLKYDIKKEDFFNINRIPLTNFIFEYEFSEFFGYYKNNLIFIKYCTPESYYIKKENSIYSVKKFIVISIYSFWENKELTKLFNNKISSLYFSFNMDLTLNYEKNNNSKQSNWIYFQNKIFLKKLFSNKFLVWCNPVIYGFFKSFFYVNKNLNIKNNVFIKIIFNIFYNEQFISFEKNKDITSNLLGFDKNLHNIEIVIESEGIINTLNLLVSKIPLMKRNDNYPMNKDKINLNNTLNDNYIFNKNNISNIIQFLKYNHECSNFYFFKNINYNSYDIYFDIIEKFKKNYKNFYTFYFTNLKKFSMKMQKIIWKNYDSIFSLFVPCLNVFYKNNLIPIIALFIDTFNEFNKDITIIKCLSNLNNIIMVLEKKLYESKNHFINDIIFNENKEIYNQLNKSLLQQFNINKKNNKKNKIIFQNSNFEDFIINFLKKNKLNLYSNYNTKILCMTFNLSGFNSNDNNLIEDLLTNKDIKNSDILVWGLQEIIEMKKKNIVKILGVSNIKEKENVVNIFKKVWLKYNFKLYLSYNMTGIMIAIFIKLYYPFKCNFINVYQEKMGFMKTWGSKGFITVQLKIGESLFGFTSCHFNSGIEKEDIKKRNEQTNYWINFLNKWNNNYNYILGDFNFRTTINYDTNKNLLNNITDDNKVITINKLIQFDEFQKNNYKILKEMKINFLPSYKYNKEIFLFKKITQSPSYCDRVFYFYDDNLKSSFSEVKYYSLQDCLISDHKPVIGFFNIKLKGLDYFKISKYILTFDSNIFLNQIDIL